MKKNLLLTVALLVILINQITAQEEISLGPTSIAEGDIYALVIGISNYKHIDSLRFADQDAIIFADYLQSDAGGNVPNENIRLLTNEQATIANIYMAKQWLEETAKEDDLVFFYFAGHGDVESSLYKLGFLLAYDTPEKNYFNNAVRIEDFNIMANTLSIVNKAKVVLITDACKSGKLAGSDNRGNQLVGDQLSTVVSNEVRIASCADSELSQEGEFWGGGRGAFSYHLVNGLKGMADEPGDEDGIITLFELEDYLEKNVMKDVFKQMKTEQTPVVSGKKMTKLAIVDEDALAEAVSEATAPRLSTSPSTTQTGIARGRGTQSVQSAADVYFAHIAQQRIDSSTVHNLTMHPTWDLTEKVVSLFPWRDSSDMRVFNYLDNVSNTPSFDVDFRRRFAAALHDQAQAAINAYLAADPNELNRRQYYNSQPSEFVHLADKLDFARSIIDSTNYLHEMMEAKSYYFRGIAKRLAYTQNYTERKLLHDATSFQLKALALDDRASYVQNEIGIIHRLMGNLFGAETAWKKAIELTPEWALPYSNLSNLYHKQGKYKLGVKYAEQAIEHENSYFMAHIMLARNQSNLDDYLTSEEHLRRSIDLNNKHYLGYEGLGYLYTNTLDYRLADTFFLEAERRKAGFPIAMLDLSDSDFDGVVDLNDVLSLDNLGEGCSLNPRDFVKEDGTAYCAYASLMWQKQNYSEAEKYFEKTVQVQNQHPTAYKYLAEIAYMAENWMRAELFANKATEYHLTLEEFEAYVEANPTLKSYDGCKVNPLVMATHYSKEDGQYLHAYLLQKIGRFSAAERVYREIIKSTRGYHPSYLHLINLHERQQQYDRAEAVIHELIADDKTLGDSELHSFYERMIEREIDVVNYHYRAGLLCYYNIPMYDLVMHADPIDIKVESDNVPVPILDLATSPSRNATYDRFKSGDDTQLWWAPQLREYARNTDKHLSAIERTAPDHILADVYQKLGDIYLYRYQIYDKAQYYYQNASNLYKNHGGLRDRQIEFYIPRYRLNEAYRQLLQLEKRGQLTYENTVTLGDFAAKKGNYDLASKIISKARSTNPVRDTRIEKSDILRLLLSEEIESAMSLVVKSIDANDTPADMNYTMARLYSLLGKDRKAVKAISKAIDNGFDHTWVLDYDPAIATLRSRNDYEEVRGRLPISVVSN